MINDANGIPLFLQGAVLDITEPKKAQTELKHSNRDLQKIITLLDMHREEEQKRLAQEMHDDLGQLLAAMKMDLSMLQQRLPQGDPRLLQQLNNINELVDAMVTSVRRIIADLPPKALDDFGLFSALKLLLSNFQKRHQIVSILKAPEPEPLLRPDIAMPIYRMVQEALNNVAKHAHATWVEVQFDCHDRRLVLQVTDNGMGTSTEKLQKQGSFGLIGMRERVAALSGEMKIQSADGAGTTIQITVPLG
jgi:two-component system sensor histidine kinase UhpB